MNYSKIYDDFICDRLSKVVPYGYSEKHHILPKSLGGSNDLGNIVRLSPEDHIFAHMLLARIHNTSGMWFALVTMLSSGGKSARGITGNRLQYGIARRAFSERLKESHHLRGVKLSNERRASISKSSPRLSGVDHPMFGRSHSDKTKKKMSLSSHRTYGQDHPMFGKKHSIGARAKMSIKNAGNGNGNADVRIHSMVCKDGSAFTGSRYDFCIKYNFKTSDGGLSRLINGKAKTFNGWEVVT